MKYFLVFITLVLMVSSLSAQNINEAAKDYKMLTDGLRNAKSISVVFESSKAEDNSQKLQGKLNLMGSDKYRLEFNNMVTVSNGKSVYQYSLINEQVIINSFGKARNYSVDAMISMIDNSFEIADYKKQSNIAEIVFKNRDEYEYLKQIKFVYNKNRMELLSVEVEDNMGSVTLYSIKKLDLNAKPKEKVFNFDIPDNVEVIDMR